MKVTSKHLDELLHYLTRMQRYKSFIELTTDADDREGYKLLYKEDEKCYVYLHNKYFGKGK